MGCGGVRGGMGWDGVMLVDRDQRGGTATFTFTMQYGRKIGNRGVGCSDIQSLFRHKIPSFVQLRYF